MNNKKDDFAYKVTLWIMFAIILIMWITCTILIIKDGGNLYFVSNVTVLLSWICISIIMVCFICIVIGISIKSYINHRVKQFVVRQEYDKGIAYIDKIPKIKLLYRIYESRFYYKGLLYLHLDDIPKAREEFKCINFRSTALDIDVFVYGIMYLLMISKEINDTETIGYIEKYVEYTKLFKANIRKNKKLTNAITVIDKLLRDDISGIGEYLTEMMDTPITQRLIAKGELC